MGDLVEDLEQASGILIDDKKLKAYLESKYFSRFNLEVEKAVFKALWKFVFRLADERCEKNRTINYSALTLLYGRNPAQFQAQVEADRDYFSTIATGGSPLVCLIHFLSRSALVTPARTPASISLRLTQASSVVGVHPIFGAIDVTAAHKDAYSLRCSCTMRTARWRTSAENFV